LDSSFVFEDSATYRQPQLQFMNPKMNKNGESYEQLRESMIGDLFIGDENDAQVPDLVETMTEEVYNPLEFSGLICYFNPERHDVALDVMVDLRPSLVDAAEWFFGDLHVAPFRLVVALAYSISDMGVEVSYDSRWYRNLRIVPAISLEAWSRRIVRSPLRTNAKNILRYLTTIFNAVVRPTAANVHYRQHWSDISLHLFQRLLAEESLFSMFSFRPLDLSDPALLGEGNLLSTAIDLHCLGYPPVEAGSVHGVPTLIALLVRRWVDCTFVSQAFTAGSSFQELNFKRTVLSRQVDSPVGVVDRLVSWERVGAHFHFELSDEESIISFSNLLPVALLLADYKVDVVLPTYLKSLIARFLVCRESKLLPAGAICDLVTLLLFGEIRLFPDLKYQFLCDSLPIRYSTLEDHEVYVHPYRTLALYRYSVAE